MRIARILQTLATQCEKNIIYYILDTYIFSIQSHAKIEKHIKDTVKKDKQQIINLMKLFKIEDKMFNLRETYKRKK